MSIFSRFGLFTRTDAQAMIEQAIKQTAEKYPEFFLNYARANEYNVPDTQVYANQANLMAQVSYLFTAVSLTSQSAASSGGGVYKTWGENKRAIDSHPFERRLLNPNPTQTGMEFLKSHFAYFLLNGNSYWWLNRTNPNSPPSEIWSIPPSQIKVIPSPTLGIEGYEYDPGDGQTMMMPEWSIVHFKDFHPSSLFVGMGRVEPASSALFTDKEEQRYLLKVYGKNNGRLPGVMAFKSPIDDETWRKIKSDMQNASAESSYMMLRGVGQNGVDLLSAANNIKDMEISQSRQMNEAEIYNTIAPGLLNAISLSAAKENATTGKKIFAEFTLYPLLTGTAQKITQKILPSYGLNLAYEFDDPRQSDRALELQEIAEYSKYHTVNEVRIDKYQSEPLREDDERGELFVAQITPAQAQQPPAIPELPAAPPMLPDEMPVPPEMEQPVSIDGEQAADNVAAELLKWQRFEIKHFGKKGKRDFVCHLVSPAEQMRIRRGLETVKNPDEIGAIFARNDGGIEQIKARLDKIIEAL